MLRLSDKSYPLLVRVPVVTCAAAALGPKYGGARGPCVAEAVVSSLH